MLYSFARAAVDRLCDEGRRVARYLVRAAVRLQLKSVFHDGLERADAGRCGHLRKFFLIFSHGSLLRLGLSHGLLLDGRQEKFRAGLHALHFTEQPRLQQVKISELDLGSLCFTQIASILATGALLLDLAQV